MINIPDWTTHRQGVRLTIGDKKNPNKLLEYVLNELKKNKNNKANTQLYNLLSKFKEASKVNVDQLMDWPYTILKSRHRKWFHDALTPILIAILYGERAGMESVIHLMMDNLFSSLTSDQQVLLKAFMNFMEQMK